LPEWPPATATGVLAKVLTCAVVGLRGALVDPDADGGDLPRSPTLPRPVGHPRVAP
jgi:hypothetical protein